MLFEGSTLTVPALLKGHTGKMVLGERLGGPNGLLHLFAPVWFNFVHAEVENVPLPWVMVAGATSFSSLCVSVRQHPSRC